MIQLTAQRWEACKNRECERMYTTPNAKIMQRVKLILQKLQAETKTEFRAQRGVCIKSGQMGSVTSQHHHGHVMDQTKIV